MGVGEICSSSYNILVSTDINRFLFYYIDLQLDSEYMVPMSLLEAIDYPTTKALKIH